MTSWTSDELNRISRAEELEIASLRGDGTLRKSTTIWMVVVGNDIYVRSVNGNTAAWHRGIQERHEGHISAGGVDKDVTFVDVDPADSIHAQIDAAYRNKYGHYAANIVNSTVTAQAQAATIKLVPR